MYSVQEHVIHENTEALQPRLTLEEPPSSSPITSIMDNTTTDDANTITNDSSYGFEKVAATIMITNASINTASSIITSSNKKANDLYDNTSSGLAINTTSGFANAGFEDTASGAGYGSSPRPVAGCLDSVAEAGSKRKRDWMNSLTQPQSDIDAGANYSSKVAGRSQSLLSTSVKITNGLYSFPAGWEQYLDLQTGETYYVNWNTRTKHCRVQCPEVQRCLAGVQQQHGSANYNSSKPHRSKESVESWLSRMTATTSALVNNKTPFVSKPPLPPPRPNFIPSKQAQPNLVDLNIKRLANIDPPHTLTSLLAANDTITTFLPASIHAMHSPHFMPNQMRDFTCFNPSIDVLNSSTLSPKPFNNALFESATTNVEVTSTSVDPIAFVCSNCNMLVMISSSCGAIMQCPNCNHVINNCSEDTTSPCAMSSSALPLLEASTIARSS